MTQAHESKLKPGDFRYQCVCCGLSWGKPEHTIAKICGVSLATVRRIAAERRHPSPPLK